MIQKSIYSFATLQYSTAPPLHAYYIKNLYLKYLNSRLGRSHQSIYSSPRPTRLRNCFNRLRLRLVSSRRVVEAFVGCVFLRVLGFSEADRIIRTSRFTASWRFCSWDRNLWASMTITPLTVACFPANTIARFFTSSASDEACRASYRICTAVEALLRCWPPGPDARMKRFWISFSSI